MACLLAVLAPRALSVAYTNLAWLELLRTDLTSRNALDHLRARFTAGPDEPSASRHWALALLAQWEEREEPGREHLRLMIGADPSRIVLARQSRPIDYPLARFAAEQYPSKSLALFWWGEAATPVDANVAISAYERALHQWPGEPVRWVELGTLYQREGRPEEALIAYDWGCILQDIGGNGCWRAGQVAEELGRPTEAIRYFEETIRQIPDYAPARERLRNLRGY